MATDPPAAVENLPLAAQTEAYLKTLAVLAEPRHTLLHGAPG